MRQTINLSNNVPFVAPITRRRATRPIRPQDSNNQNAIRRHNPSSCPMRNTRWIPAPPVFATLMLTRSIPSPLPGAHMSNGSRISGRFSVRTEIVRDHHDRSVTSASETSAGHWRREQDTFQDQRRQSPRFADRAESAPQPSYGERGGPERNQVHFATRPGVKSGRGLH